MKACDLGICQKRKTYIYLFLLNLFCFTFLKLIRKLNFLIKIQVDTAYAAVNYLKNKFLLIRIIYANFDINHSKF